MPATDKPWTSTLVTLETAMNADSKKDGKYWDMDLKKLTPRFNEIDKMLKENKCFSIKNLIEKRKKKKIEGRGTLFLLISLGRLAPA